METLRVAPGSKPGAIRAALPSQPPEQGEPFEKILADVDRVILPGMVHWSHPMFLAYFGWTATAPGILSEMISAPLNVNAMTWRTCPAATELETLVIDWLRQWMRLPKNFDGVVYDTASVGIMHALAVAREEAAPSTRKLGLTGRNLPRFRIYTSDQAHSSAEKAAIALGLGEESVCRVSSDKEFRMDTCDPARIGRCTIGSPDSNPRRCCHSRNHLNRERGSSCRNCTSLPREKDFGCTSMALMAPVLLLFRNIMDRRGLERSGFDRRQSTQDVVCSVRFQRALFARYRSLRRLFTLVPEYLRGDSVEAEIITWITASSSAAAFVHSRPGWYGAHSDAREFSA